MDDQTRRIMFSSATDEWSTPRDLIEAIRQEYPIVLDVCANWENAVCDSFFDRETNGLAQRWEGVCWMNPPYGDAENACAKVCKKKRCAERGFHIDVRRPGIGDWVAKAAASAAEGATVVCLLPSRTDTAWWHEHCEPVLRGKAPGEVVFLRGRLKFGGAANGAPFPSVIVVFKPRESP